MSQYVFGVEDAVKLLEGVKASFTSQMIDPAAKKALVPVRQAAKSNITKFAKRKSKSNKREFSKARFISRGIIITKINRKNGGGARVGVNHRMGIQMSANRRWNLSGAAKLYGAGAYKTPQRKGHGAFAGYGNFIADAGVKYSGAVSRRFTRYLFENLQRYNSRVVKR